MVNFNGWFFHFGLWLGAFLVIGQVVCFVLMAFNSFVKKSEYDAIPKWLNKVVFYCGQVWFFAAIALIAEKIKGSKYAKMSVWEYFDDAFGDGEDSLPPPMLVPASIINAVFLAVLWTAIFVFLPAILMIIEILAIIALAVAAVIGIIWLVIYLQDLRQYVERLQEQVVDLRVQVFQLKSTAHLHQKNARITLQKFHD